MSSKAAVVYRPIHSPTFAGVEPCFNWIDLFLQHHDAEVNEHNLKSAIEAAVDCITAEDVRGYMAHAHFAVEGHEFRPYMGYH